MKKSELFYWQINKKFLRKLIILTIFTRSYTYAAIIQTVPKENSIRFVFSIFQPVGGDIPETPVLKSCGDRPFKTTFEDQLKMLIFFHLEEHVSARHMLQVIEQNDFARENIAPEEGIKKSRFSEAINTRGLNSSKSYLKNSAERYPAYCPIDTLILAILSPLMASIVV